MTPAQRSAKRKAVNKSGGTAKYGSRVRGKGAYTYSKPGPWGRYGRSIGATLGKQFLSPYVGNKAAGTIGSAAGGLAHYIGRIFGSGDYVKGAPVKANSIISPQAPSFSAGASTVNIKHREFLGDVVSSSTAGAFQISAFPLNPGLSLTFPWLSQVCGATFQQYRINGMVFEYRTMSADALNSVNTALGQVVMCTDYDSADTPFTTKQQMENTEFGVSCKPSCNMLHAIECAPRLTTATELYVRAFANPSNTDIRLYDWGRTYVATNGFQGTNVNCGELWVSYDITFFKTIEQPPGYLIPVAHYQLNPANFSTNLTSVLSTNTGLDNIGITVGSSTFHFPVSINVNSVWYVELVLLGTATGSAGNIAATLTGGLVALSTPLFLGNSSNTLYQVGSATGAVTQGVGFVCKYNGTGTIAVPPTVTFQLTGGGSLSAYSAGDLLVNMLPANIT